MAADPNFTHGIAADDGVDLSDEDTILAHAFNLSPDLATAEYQAWHAPSALDRAQSAYTSGQIGPAVGGESGKRRIIDAYKDLSKMPPDAVSALQRQLYDAGFFDDSYYKKGGPRPEYGDLDDATIDAYKQVILRSFRSNGRLTPGDIINEGLTGKHGENKAKGLTPKPPSLTIELTDPNDLLAVADATARKVMGRKLTDPELRHFIDSFHSMEANAQQSKFAAEVGPYDEASGTFRGPGGTITAPPSAQDYAISQLRAEHPEDVRNTEMAQGFEIFHDLLRGNA